MYLRTKMSLIIIGIIGIVGIFFFILLNKFKPTPKTRTWYAPTVTTPTQKHKKQNIKFITLRPIKTINLAGTLNDDDVAIIGN
jgi:hypothetical protein